MASHYVIELVGPHDDQIGDALREAADLAENEHRMTFLARNGKRIGAIVPVGVAVALEPGGYQLPVQQVEPSQLERAD
jgi:hypothetical protein